MAAKQVFSELNKDEIYFTTLLYDGDIEKCKKYNKKKIDIHKRSNIFLGIAIDIKNKELFEWLINEGADIHVNNEALLILVINNNDLDMCKFLFSLGSNPFVTHNLPFLLAVENGNIDICEWLYDIGVDVTTNDFLAFEISAKRGDRAMYSWLNLSIVQNSIDMNQYIKINNKCCIIAAKNNKFRVCSLINDVSMQVDYTLLYDITINTTLFWAAFFGDLKTFKTLYNSFKFPILRKQQKLTSRNIDIWYKDFAIFRIAKKKGYNDIINWLKMLFLVDTINKN